MITHRTGAFPGAAMSLRPPLGRCSEEGCGGVVVRHSLGCGLATHRCLRCFRDQDALRNRGVRARSPGRMRRIWRDLLTWREYD